LAKKDEIQFRGISMVVETISMGTLDSQHTLLACLIRQSAAERLASVA
jgi:hypothetical protein